jgi:basic membrane protein A and related proteins
LKKVFRLVAVVAATVMAATAFVAPATAATKVKVGLAYDIGGRGDKSFNDSAAAGLDLAKKKFGVAAKEVTVTTGFRFRARRQAPLASKGWIQPNHRCWFPLCRTNQEGCIRLSKRSVRNHR